jgi:small-conductance mechanosensitive channel
MKFSRNARWLVFWGLLTLLFAALDTQGVGIYTMPNGQMISSLLMVIAAVMMGYHLSVLIIQRWVESRHGAPGEVSMLSGLLRVVVAVAIGFAILSLFGQLGPVFAALGAFSGLLLGWSLQAPVSGVAAWIMISIKRPFRVGDRVQFPSLGLVGDVLNVDPMYTVLNQVGGAVSSEEAIGRSILIPNAMLFSNVVINYTARQDAAFFLDEVVVRVTYDTNWDDAEKILLDAAREVTADIIAQTKQEPFVRADMYDYGIYMRLRFMTSATDRPRISYEIIRRIFRDFQHSAQVDFAIPYVYSFRKGVQASARFDEALKDRPTEDVPLGKIIISEEERDQFLSDDHEIEELAAKIRQEGLVQPIVLSRARGGQYRVIVGHRRVDACKRLGWRSIPAIIRDDIGLSERE